MRRYLVLLSVCVAAVALAVLAGGVRVARASTACTANASYDMGYTHGGSPGVGASMSAVLDYGGSSIRNSGSIRDYISVENPFDSGQHLIVGIRNVGSGPQLYTEWEGVFSGVTAVNRDTDYTVEIRHTGSNTWAAEWYDPPYTYTLTESMQFTPNSDFIVHTSTTSSTCNVVYASFNSVSPWALGTSTTVQDNNSGGIYGINLFSSSQFNVYGPRF